MIKIFLFVISIIIILFVSIFKKEGFLSDYRDYTFIDRIKDRDKYAYCIGGNVLCPSGNLVKIDDYDGGTTYNSVCHNNTPIVCNNFINSKKSSNLDISGDKYLWNTPKGVPLHFSTLYKGFTVPTPYIPIKLNGNYFSIYDSNNNLLDTINKCSTVNDTYRCEMATHSLDNSYGDASFVDVSFTNILNVNLESTDVSNIFQKTYQEKLPILNTLTDINTDIKNGCLADYGSQIGDNLCDGAMGLLKDSSSICPYYKPICDYKCGSSLGRCNYKSKI
uniref:Uncharacterized protein n=1 Tax=viral metagenome TaxID=1070528 RepID=A0A6C0EVX2_9ZZZZ